MTDRKQFEQMLEALINEDQETAKEIFHNIVVAKSREIYEELLESDFGDKPKDDKEVDEAEDKEEDTSDDFSAKDSTDDQIDDVEADDSEDDEFGGEEEGGEEEIEDRVQDLEDALEDLKAEFEQLMAGEEEEPEHDDMFGGEEEPADEFGMDDEDEMAENPMDMDPTMGVEEEVPTAGTQVVHVQHSFNEDEQLIREYVEKVGGATYDKFGKMGDNGANTKSPVAGKNDMGGTVANIAQGHVEVSSDVGAKTTVQGSALSSNKPKDMNTGNINVPGGNAGKTAFKKREPGHGAEKKGAAEQADKSASSALNGVKSRAK